MRRAASGLLLGLCVAMAALVLAPVRDVSAEVLIAAPPLRVWAVLTDTAAYRAWNPDMRLVGRLQAGEVIEHDQGQGADRMVFHPVVLVAEPGRVLRWFGRVWFWHVLDATHAFTLTPAGGGTRLVQSERLCGVALWLFDARRLLPGFEAMDAALKRRVETAG